MADNVVADPGSGGATFAADDISGVMFPRTKLTIGADGTNDGDVSSANPLPVKGTGTAGTANSGVLTVQGIASMTPVQIADNGGSLTVDGTVAATQSGTWTVDLGATDNSVLDAIAASLAGTLTVGSHAVTNAGTFAVQVSSALPAGTNAIGKLAANSGVDIGDVDVTSVPADPFGTNADAASATGSISAKLRFIAATGIPITGTVTVGSHAVTNAGTFAVQAAQSGTWTVQPGNTANTTAWLVTGTGGTFPATQSGTWNIGTVTTLTTCSTVTSLTQFNGNAIATNTGNASSGTLRVVLATDQPALTTPMPHSPAASTTGGATPYKYIIAAGTNQDSQSVKASAGTLYSIAAFSVVASVRYLKLYDKNSAPTSADTPIHVFAIPGNTAGAGLVESIPTGLAFSNGIAFRVTTGIADNDANAASANDGVINLGYK